MHSRSQRSIIKGKINEQKTNKSPLRDAAAAASQQGKRE
jgi:hypothetical protein